MEKTITTWTICPGDASGVNKMAMVTEKNTLHRLLINGSPFTKAVTLNIQMVSSRDQC
jgi:hypothetical protein